MSGRFIGESTRLTYDIMHYVDKNNLQGMLMLIDFQKAFDSVSWSFLSNVLDFFNFGKSFCKWINVFNNNIQASILQSGFLSKFFSIQRGCRQGDPIASYLFLLCGQIMYLMVDNNLNIKGITVNNRTHKITQFADDTTMFLDGSRDSLLAILNTLEIFGSLSGLKVNTDKTKIIWLGKKKHSQDMYDTLKKLDWGATEFNLLGLQFSVDLTKMTTLNFNLALVKINKILNRWKKWNLSPFGKIVVIKTFVISTLNHMFASLPSPDKQTISNLNHLLYSFLWDNKPNKISQKQITNDYLHGGLKMVDIEMFILSQKVAWIRRLFVSPESPWVQVFLTMASPERLYMMGNLWPLIFFW